LFSKLQYIITGSVTKCQQFETEVISHMMWWLFFLCILKRDRLIVRVQTDDESPYLWIMEYLVYNK